MNITEQAIELNRILENHSPSILSLLSDTGKSAFFPKTGILSQSAEAKGKRINATIGIALDDDGEPLPMPPVTENSKLNARETVLYSPSYGQKELRELWLQRIKQNNPSLVSNQSKTSLPICTNGLTGGLGIIAKLFVEPGEKLITPNRIWGNYKLVFQHAELETFPVFDGEVFNVQGLRQKLDSNPGKQIILLNFPNNPTGYSPTSQEVEEIVSTIKQSAESGNNILVICDDAYFGLFFEDNIFKESIFSKLATLHENVLAVKLDGITKEMYAWGLRVGFITYACKGMAIDVAKVLEDKTSGIVRGTVSNICTHSQFLALKALKNPELNEHEKQNYQTLKTRYDEVKRVLSNEKYKECFDALPYNSGYFMCIQLKNADGEAVRKKLLDNHDTGVIAIGNLLRIAFSSVKTEMIEQLFENIYQACKI